MALQRVSDTPARVAQCYELHRGPLVTCVTLSPVASRLANEGRLRITGDPDGTLTFTEVNLETGRMIREWESTV
jgi:hypothetical protein